MKLIYSAIAIAALLAFGIGGCNMYKTNKELRLENEKQEQQIIQAQLDKALLQDSVTTFKAEVKKVRAEDYGVADNVSSVTTVQKDYKVAAQLKKLQEQYATMADSLSTQRDRERREKEILEEYCIQLQDKNQLDAQKTIDSLVNETVLPLFFTQQDLPWYVIDVMIIDSIEDVRMEFYYADEFNITHKKIKKDFMGWLRPKDLEVSVQSLNPYSVGNSATTYLIKK